jgi:hypothetical protein
MGKKRSRTPYTSKGQRRSVSKDTTKAVRRQRPSMERTLNQQRAFREGRNVVLTVPNTTGKDTKKHAMLRVKASTLWSNKPYTIQT